MAMDTLSKLALAQITSNNKSNNDEMNMTKSSEPKVLDEESHTANIEKIIERDFFPDLKKMQVQLQYMDAVERKDVQKMWELQQKYSMKRTTNTPSTYGTPSTFETPEAFILQTPGGTDSRKKADTTTAASLTTTPQNVKKKPEAPTHNPDPEEARDQELSKLSLNSYMRKYTSEDDKAFSEIMSEAQKRHQMKHAWLYKNEQLQIEDNKDRKQVDTWNYVAKNAVMYVPEGVELSISEKLEMSKLQKQEIVHSNTRFATQPFSQVPSDSMNRNNVISNQILKLEGKVGPDGKELLPTETPTINGYKIMPTPSPAPGVDASPLMTWGEIEGTPFRLDGMETPRFGGSSSGPNFKIPEVPKRDRLLHQLADKASKAHRAKKMEALKQAAATFSSSPRSFMSKTERLQSLSPAAQRLVSSKLRINSNSSLKASYTPSPCNTPGSDKLTPKMTPKSSAPSPKRKSAKSNENKWNDDSLLTDNLLKLPAKKQRAQDFF